MGRSTRHSSQRRMRVASTHPSPGPPAVFLVPPDCPVGDSPPRPLRPCSPRSAPGTSAGRPRRALAVELVTDVTRADTQITAEDAQLGEVVTGMGTGTGTSLTDIKGVGVVMAALIRARPGVPVQSPRDLHRQRPHRGQQRGDHPPPALPCREPAAQPRPARRRAEPPPLRRPRQGLLRPQGRRGQGQEGRHAVPQAPAVRRGLPPPRRRREGPPVDRRARGRARHGPLPAAEGRARVRAIGGDFIPARPAQP